MTEELVRMIQDLADRQAIQDVLARYSRGVDRLDRELLLSVYHADAVDDHGFFVGGPEAFADTVFALHRKLHHSHQHYLFNSSVEIDGDVAHAETYYMFAGINQSGEPLAMSGGRYLDRLEKRNGRWAISVRICVRDWAPLKEIPNPLDQSTLTVVALDERTRAMMRTGRQPARNPSDPSYDRPLSIPAERQAETP